MQWKREQVEVIKFFSYDIKNDRGLYWQNGKYGLDDSKSQRLLDNLLKSVCVCYVVEREIEVKQVSNQLPQSFGEAACGSHDGCVVLIVLLLLLLLLLLSWRDNDSYKR